MEQPKVYDLVLVGPVDHDCNLIGHFQMPMNPRYLVVIGDGVDEPPHVFGGQEPPDADQLPVGSNIFHRVGSAVWTSHFEASSLYEYVGTKL